MGSAAVFFAIEPGKAVLSDINEDLVICLEGVKRDPFAVMDILDGMPNTKEYFESARRIDRTQLDGIDRAALVIYLNKTCFRGLWRVNARGEFNVPYGNYRRPYYNRDTLLKASKALQEATIRCWSYEQALRAAKRDDWIYLDPPYVPTGAWGDFTRYTPDRFPLDAQERLASAVRDVDERGIMFLLTNSDTPLVRELYSGFPQWTFPTRRDIDLRAENRASRDLVIANYEEFKNPLPTGLRRVGHT